MFALIGQNGQGIGTRYAQISIVKHMHSQGRSILHFKTTFLFDIFTRAGCQIYEENGLD